MKTPLNWLALAFIGGILLAGCNTMEGMGEDIQAAGSTVSGWAGSEEKADSKR